MRVSNWTSDVCSSDLQAIWFAAFGADFGRAGFVPAMVAGEPLRQTVLDQPGAAIGALETEPAIAAQRQRGRSEEHTSELQSLMRISYAVFCLKKKTKIIKTIICKSMKNNKINR